MSYVVEKEFKTVNRKFRPGMVITAADIDGHVTVDTWKNRGFIREEVVPIAASRAPVTLEDELRTGFVTPNEVRAAEMLQQPAPGDEGLVPLGKRKT
jgi:hypothetical protein